MTEKLEALKNKFWTDLEELIKKLYELGFWVDDYNNQFLVYSDVEGWEDTEWVIHLISAGTTYTIQKIEVIF